MRRGYIGYRDVNGSLDFINIQNDTFKCEILQLCVYMLQTEASNQLYADNEVFLFQQQREE
jgi:hypothetical protein